MNCSFIALTKTLIFSLFLFSLPLYGNILKTQLESDLPTLMEKVVEWRHDFHQYPELGKREFKTAKKIRLSIFLFSRIFIKSLQK